MIARRNPLWLALLALTGCGKFADEIFCASAGCDWSPGEWGRVAALANPDDPPPDRSNVFWDNPDARRLGQAFFFDTGFSGNATEKTAINTQSPAARSPLGQPIGVSCATCHDLSRAGVDTTSVPGHVSVGAGWTDVNALPVVNSAYRNVVFWNGRADSLWALNVVVAESPTTVNGNRLAIAHRIFDVYRKDFERIFGPLDPAIGFDSARFPPSGKPGKPEFDGMAKSDRDAITRILVNWAKAIAAYESTLVSNDSDFDRYVSAGPSSNAISASAIRGARLFVGKAACSTCHSGPQLTDELFHDIGIPQIGQAVPTLADCPEGNADCDCVSPTALKCAPWGAYDGLRRLRNTTDGSKIQNHWLRTGDPNDHDNQWTDDRTDTSRVPYVEMPLTDKLKGTWRTPSLRNVALTAPYMHDGRYATLQEVVWHYNNGGQASGPEPVGDLAPEIKPLMLTDQEQADLVAFLESLTGAPLPAALTQAPVATTGGGGSGQSTGAGGGGGFGGSQPAGGAGGRAPSGAGGFGPGAGGMGSLAGSGGAGGSSRPLACTRLLHSPLIADFEDAVVDPVSGAISFGTPPGLTGTFFARGSAGVAPPQASLRAGLGSRQGLFVSRPPITTSGSYEFGLIFDDCVDATAFNTIQFTGQDMGTNCPAQFSALAVNNVSPTDDPRGRCSANTSCDPLAASVSLAGTVRAPLLPNNPSDLSAVIELRWRFPGSCGVAATIDDIRFVTQ